MQSKTQRILGSRTPGAPTADPRAGKGKALRAILRVLAGVGLLAFVIGRLDTDELLRVLSGVASRPLALALLAIVASKFVWTMRWQGILHANGIERGFWQLMPLLMVGLFFNSFLPTSIGGDLVRGYYTTHGSTNQITSYLVVLVERALGLISLAGLATLAALVGLFALEDSLVTKQFLFSTVVFGSLVIVTGCVVFLWPGWSQRLEFLSRLGAGIERLVSGVAAAVELFHRPQTRTLSILATSLAVQVISVLAYLACARAVGIEIPTMVFFLLTPISAIASMIPLTLNGLGIREGVLVGLLVHWGAPSAAAGAFALLALALSLISSLIGGLIYSFYRLPPTTG